MEAKNKPIHVQTRFSNINIAQKVITFMTVQNTNYIATIWLFSFLNCEKSTKEFCVEWNENSP